MELDFDKVAESLERIAAALGEVYASSLHEAVIVAGTRTWLMELAVALRAERRAVPLGRLEPSLN